MIAGRATALARALPLLVLGLGLMAAALPRIAAYGSLLGPGDLADAWMDAQPRPAADIAQSYRFALAVLPGEAALGERMGQKLLRAGDAEGAAAALGAAAGDAPNRTEIWCALALAEGAAGESAEKVAAAIRLSYLTGPYSGDCAPRRTRAALAGWPNMPDDVRARVGDELRLMWQTGSTRLALIDEYLAVGFEARILIRRYALTSPEDIQSFNRMTLATLRARRGGS
ncbi:MAG: hypothetical protein P4L72_09235 [Parvibaculum sp.]|jgi:hypothetical protein|uniref:hypothetical protein n=1 Tax=Parvibaculum sp. TaxID=2024848 RepID=UPI00283F733D|nr:hypothetical protein [Parvibaculum sp.]MDR3499397.1 hypothetical protein [Parvibaculum sp.]